VKIEKDDEGFSEVKSAYSQILNVSTTFISLLAEAFKDGYDALFKSVENEAR
jgi:Zn-dependent M32 family carboxypeptidase